MYEGIIYLLIFTSIFNNGLRKPTKTLTVLNIATLMVSSMSKNKMLWVRMSLELLDYSLD